MATVAGAVFVPWGALLLAHLALALARPRADESLLPLVGLVLTVGAAYHTGLLTARGESTLPGYLTSAGVAVAVTTAVPLLAHVLRRVRQRVEERVWWPLVGDYEFYGSLLVNALLLAAMGVLTVWLLASGRSAGGARVLAPLPGGFSFTPSEFIRLGMALFLGEFLARNARLMRHLRSPIGGGPILSRIVVERRPELLLVIGVLALYALFFFVLRDFGPAAIIGALTLLCLYAATGRWTTPILLAGGALLVVGLPSALGHAPGVLTDRLAMWRDPWDTRFAGGDHLARVLWAIAAGGPFGARDLTAGAGARLPAFVPEAARDTAFAGVSASLGSVTALILLGTFALLAWRGYQIAFRSRSDMSRLLAFSLTTLLALQVVWICGACVGVLPLSGINLPFVSTGLSSMVASALLVGWLLHLSDPRAIRAAEAPSPVIARATRRVAGSIATAYALPALGLLLAGVPFLRGDAILTRPTRARTAGGQIEELRNPILERFRSHLPLGRVFSIDSALLAVSDPDLAGADGTAIEVASSGFTAWVRAHPTERRYYPLGAAGSLLVGWTPEGRYTAPPEAVESAFSDDLRGYSPEELPRLYRLRVNPLAARPQPRDLVLTVDSRLQRTAYDALRRAVRRWRGAGGAVLVYDPESGEVLCAASAPAVDPNGLTAKALAEHLRNPRARYLLRNKALSARSLYPPGSSFKIVTAAASLTTPADGEVLCVGHNAQRVRWEWRGRDYAWPAGRLKDYARQGHGTLDLSRDLDRAFTRSCNVFFGHLAAAVGPEALLETMRRAEFNRVPPLERIADYLPFAGFGQVVPEVAPVEMARLAGAVGVAQSGGDENALRTVAPYWVAGTRAQQGTQALEDGRAGTRPRGRFAPFAPDVAGQLRSMMLSVCNDPGGTAWEAFGGAGGIAYTECGGKTGTAEFRRVALDARGRQRKDSAGKPVLVTSRHAWFVGFGTNQQRFPPRTLAIAVLLEDVRARATGGNAAAPVARRLLEEAFRLLNPS